MPTRGPTVKFWLHPDFAQTPQVKGPVPQDFPLLQMPVPSPRLWLVLLTNWPESWSLHTRFLGFSNLLEWLTELREVLYSLLPVYYKAFDSGIAKGKKYIGQGILEMVWRASTRWTHWCARGVMKAPNHFQYTLSYVLLPFGYSWVKCFIINW